MVKGHCVINHVVMEAYPYLHRMGIQKAEYFRMNFHKYNVMYNTEVNHGTTMQGIAHIGTSKQEVKLG